MLGRMRSKETTSALLVGMQTCTTNQCGGFSENRASTYLKAGPISLLSYKAFFLLLVKRFSLEPGVSLELQAILLPQLSKPWEVPVRSYHP